MGPFQMGRQHAAEFLRSLGPLEINQPIYLNQEEVWPEAGPYTWDQYIKGAKSLLGEGRVCGGRRPASLPSVLRAR